MKYVVYYDLGCCEGWYYETFDNFSEALQFAEKQQEAHITKYTQMVPITYNIKLLY